MKVSPEYNFTYYTNSVGGQIFTGRGVLHYITVNLTTAATIGVIDGTSGSTANVAKLKTSVAEGTYRYDVTVANGLRIVGGSGSSHMGDVTVVWSQG